MENCLIGFPNRVDASTLSGGSWVASLPLTNLKRRELSQVARSTNLALASTQLNLDLGTSRSTRIFAAVNHNMTTAARYRLRGAADTTQNRVTNSTMVGAAAGSPGTLPTGWANIITAGGIASTLALGTEDGLAYLDVRITGTMTPSSGGVAIYFLPLNAVPGVPGSTHSLGANMRLVSGTVPLSVNLGIDELNGAGTGVGGYGTFTSPSGISLSAQRYTCSRVIQAAGSVYARPYIYIPLLQGQAVDFTLRIAALMFNAGLQPFDHIPTSGAAVTAPAFAEYDSSADMSVNKRFFFPEAIAAWTSNGAIATNGMGSTVLTTADINLLAYPRHLDNAAWIHAGTRNAQVYVRPNVALNPINGKMTADRFCETTAAAADHYIYQNRNTTNERATFYAVVRAAGRRRIQMQISNFVNASANATFDLVAGTLLNTNSGGADFTQVSGSITAMTDGYYLCSVTATKGSFNNICSPVIWIFTDTGVTNYTGDGVSGIDIAHTQYELGDVRTSPISDATVFTGRAGVKWEFNSSGILVQSAAGVAVEAYDPVTLVSRDLSLEEAATNQVRNNTMTGATLGALGSGGVLPTNWQSNISAVGLTRTLVGVGIEDGVEYLDFRFQGTVTTAGDANIVFDALPYATTTTPGQTWTSSVFATLVGGSLTNVSAPYLVLEEYTAANVYLAGSVGTLNALGTGRLPAKRYSVTRSLSTGVAARVGGYIGMAFSLGAVDVTLRLGLPQLELGRIATSPIKTAGAVVTRAADTSTSPPARRPAELSAPVHGADPTLSNDTLFIDGSKGYMIQLRVRRVAGTGWDGGVYFRTSAHSYTEATKGYMDQPSWGADGWATITVDMRKTAGGAVSDFHTASAVTAVRFDFGSQNTDIFELAWVAFGVAPTSYNSLWKDVFPVVYDYGTLEWEDDGWWSGRYTEEELAGYTRTLPIILPEAKSYRYWTLELDDATNAAGYLDLGRIFIGPAWQPTKNASYGLSRQFETTTTTQTSLSGVERFQPQKPKRVTRFAIENITENEGLSRAFDMDRQAGIDKEVFWVENPADTVHALRRQFLGRFRTLGALEAPSYNLSKKTYEIGEIL